MVTGSASSGGRMIVTYIKRSHLVGPGAGPRPDAVHRGRGLGGGSWPRRPPPRADGVSAVSDAASLSGSACVTWGDSDQCDTQYYCMR